MKKLRLKGLDDKMNCSTVIERCIKTVDGFEDAYVDLGTGTISYAPSTSCVDVDLLKEAFAKEGITAEDVK